MTEHVVLVILRLGVVAAASLSSLWSLRLALNAKDHRGTYLLLASGFGLLALAPLVEGFLFEFVRWDLASAHTVEAFVSIGAFALVLLSILRSNV